MNQFKTPRRIFECYARFTPFVGLAGTTYGIINAFNKLDSRGPNDLIDFPRILDAILAGFAVSLILSLALLVWHWLSNK
jgi:flagellar motor component MotA